MRKEFEVHILNEIGKAKATALAQTFSDCLQQIENCVGFADGREMAIVRTKLEEACFFAKKAIASNILNQQ